MSVQRGYTPWAWAASFDQSETGQADSELLFSYCAFLTLFYFLIV